MTGHQRTAFVFPGQGSQSIGMLSALAARYPTIHSVFDDASAVLGYNLWDLVQRGPEAELNATVRTQPALLTASVAVWKVWKELGGPDPDLMAGHSLGEYSALVCAGAMRFDDAVQLVADRGRFMQEAVPEGNGAMAAILGLADADVADICRQAAQNETVSPANFNSPAQVVIAGDSGAVKRAVDLAAAAGAKRSIMLPVSVPSHCDLMRAAAARLEERLGHIPVTPGVIPVIQNADVSINGTSDAIRQALIEQLYRPVRWVDIILLMTDQGVARVVECGPGNVLSGLIKRIDRKLELFSGADPESLTRALTAFH